MSNDFWAGYLSGAIGIIIGNPLDVLKVRRQASSSNAIAAGDSTRQSIRGQFESTASLVRGN
jgi:solute carrier family 25 carnitine/acylcarnitine transporter 20/29